MNDAEPTIEQLPWHNMSKDEVLDYFETSQNGLTKKEQSRRLEKYGPNELRQVAGISPIRLLLEQFQNYLIIILLVAVALSAILEEYLDAFVIFVIVIFAALLGFIQEYRAERAIEALREMTAPTASVIREGKQYEIASVELVPGDIIPIAVGDKIPADARLLESINLKTDEAALTGESLSIAKDSEVLIDEKVPLGDRKTMLYTGANSTYGRGLGVVVSTGMNTEFGKIAGLLEEVESGQTPLQRNLDELGKTLAKISLAIIFLVFIVGIIRNHDVAEMFVFSIALAVAVVPEALPAVITISLAIGVQKMSNKNALIRKLPAVETLGATSVICSDKTGTLTKAEMTVRKVNLFHSEFDMSIKDLSKFKTESKQAQYLLYGSTLCNDVKIEGEGKDFKFLGDPTEIALKSFAFQLGHGRGTATKFPRIDEIPFTSERKMMTTLHRFESKIFAFTKGAPEYIINRSTLFLEENTIKPLTPEKSKEMKIMAEEMARNALRTLAIGYRELNDEYNRESVENEFILLGFIGMIDPPRDGVSLAVKECKAAGIKPVMITGDHMITAVAIAKEIGIAQKGIALTGTELDELSEQELEEKIEEIEVFARVSPTHKLRVVEAYSKRGHIVAMTGDGINDAPALKRADVGIAMGIKGTDVTKEAADMILADDNFVSIVGAVEEGRIMFANIKKYLMYLLSANLGEILILGLAIFLGWDLPLVAIQILYINLATDGLPALALSVDPAEEDFMSQMPRDPSKNVFTKPVVKLMILGGVTSAIVNLSLFYYLQHYTEMSLEQAQCMIFCTLILIEFFKAFSFRSDHQSILSYGPFSNHWLNLAVFWESILFMIIIYLPFLQEAFGTFNLGLTEWIFVLVCALTIIPTLEFGKWFFVRRFMLSTHK